MTAVANALEEAFAVPCLAARTDVRYAGNAYSIRMPKISKTTRSSIKVNASLLAISPSLTWTFLQYDPLICIHLSTDRLSLLNAEFWLIRMDRPRWQMNRPV